MPDEELGKAVGLGAKKVSAGDFSKGGDEILVGFIQDEEKQGSDEDRDLIGAHTQQSASMQVCTSLLTNFLSCIRTFALAVFLIRCLLRLLIISGRRLRFFQKCVTVSLSVFLYMLESITA